MLGATFYIIVCSAKNRMRIRLRRLREPRYLLGAVAAIVYFYFTIFARTGGGGMRRAPRRRGGPAGAAPIDALRSVGPTLVGMALLLNMALAWLFPGNSGLLEFSAAETQFLFPAPVSRRALLVHRLMRSQLGLLFAAVIPAIAFPSGSTLGRARFAVGMWVLLVTMRVHFTGITLARASLRLREARIANRQWGALALMLGAAAIVAGTTIRAFVVQPATGFSDAVGRLDRIGANPSVYWILWPFRTLAAPLFASTATAFFAALAGALVILAANVVWVLRSDDGFQEAVAEAEARRAAKTSRQRLAVRPRAIGWTLPLVGRPETMFGWKNSLQMLRGLTGVTAIRYIAPLVGISVAGTSILMAATRARGASAVAGLVALAVAGFCIVLGPQVVRSDLREDLLHLELLKTWPVHGDAVVRGEMLAPAAVLTAVSWIALACALSLSAAAFTTMPFAVRGIVAVAVAILAPAIIAAQFTVHNAAAILFPAWVPLGTQRPKGLDAMGQRLILFFGIVLALIVMLAPAVIPAAVVWLLFYRWLGFAVLIVAAAMVSGIVLFEVLVATAALGPAYDRLDLTAVERAE
jgi:hypothetical protein